MVSILCLCTTLTLIGLTLLIPWGILKYIYTYWRRMGFPELPPNIPLGCLSPVVRTQTKSLGENLRDIHLNNPGVPYLGIYMFFRPVLLIRDPKLVKRILITDFDHFHDRGMHCNESTDPIAANLFVLPGKKWKDLRAKFSPTFSSAKLKTMFPVIVKNTKLLQHHLNPLSDQHQVVPMKDLVSRTTIDIIASVFFGLELNAIAEPNHVFVLMGKLFMEEEDVRQKLTNLGIFLFPQMFPLFNLRVVRPSIHSSIIGFIQRAIELRRIEILSNCSPKNDFIETILNLMEEDTLMSLENCAAQAFFFYVAGYETSATTATFCLYELVKCPKWMGKVQREVDAVFKMGHGQLHYADLGKLKSLDLCLKETMRKYPALPILNRECTKDYQVPGTKDIIKRGTPVIVSNFGLQMDENYFPDPNRFDPSRFEGEDHLNLETFPFYPAGAGPRYCLGQ